LAPFGFKVFVNRILIEAGRRLPPTFNYVRDAAIVFRKPVSIVTLGVIAGDTKIEVGLSFDLLEHPADIGFRARGTTLEELFANSAHALVSIILDADIRPVQLISVPGTGADRESLLINWLNEVLYHVDGRRMALGTFNVVSVDETSVECVAGGEPRDRDRHPPRMGLKAVTYHQLKVARTADGWVAEVYLDI